MTTVRAIETLGQGASRRLVNRKARITVLVCGLMLCFLAVLVRAWQLQVMQSEELRAMAEKLHRGVAAEISYRGSLLDRNGVELAKDIAVDSVYADPLTVRDPSAAASLLARALGLDPKELEGKLGRQNAFVMLKRRLSDEEKERVASLGIEGVGLRPEPVRYYPNGDLAAHAIGFVGADGKGLEGLELAEETVLAGKAGDRFVQRDARRRLLDLTGDGLAGEGLGMRGADVVLTIDRGLQHLLQDSLDGAAREAGAKGAMGVILDPQTAEVLALASWPAFQPNAFNTAAPSAIRNRAITDAFEPGSTLKVFLAAAALESGIDPSERFFCEKGAYRLPHAVIHDHAPYGWLTFQRVIQVSSNIGASKIAERIGAEKLYATLRNFGFGRKTGIELPGEAPGLMRPLARWSAMDLRTASFGQGVSVTAIQLASALSAIANGGIWMSPTLIREVRGPEPQDQATERVGDSERRGVLPARWRENGRTERKEPGREGRRVISERTAAELARMMTTVTQDGGTGKLAAVEGFEVAGKTGTAQKVDPATRRYSETGRVSSFMGFVSAESPRLAIVIVLDEPQGRTYGGLVAAPAFREVAQAALSYLRVPAEKLAPPPAPEPAQTGSRPEHAAVRGVQGVQEEPAGMPDFRGKPMREVLREAARHELRVNLEGTGVAVGQVPKPGEEVSAGAGCRVVFSPPA